jgi:two-component system cell cycle sensor histidine kinase PleC
MHHARLKSRQGGGFGITATLMDDNADKVAMEERRPPRPSRARKPDDMKVFRERLVNGNEIKPEFEYELLAMFARNEISAPLAMPALCIIFSIASMFWASWAESGAWIAAVILTRWLMNAQCKKLLSMPRTDVNVTEWRRFFLLLELLNGMVLAGFALIGFGTVSAGLGEAAFSSHVFIFATLMVVLAIRMTFASTVRGVFLAGTVPMTLAVAARLFWLNDPFYYALASMAVGIHLFFVYLTRGLHSTALAMIEFRAEKDALIAELEEATAISDEARRRAEAGNKAKSRFLATMSHELRTPLNAIMGFSEVMEKELLGPVGNETYREYSRNIYASGSHLLNIINEILDLSRIEAGRYELHEETIRLTDVAEDCERLVKLKADGKGLQLIEEFAPDLPQVWADPRAMRQICLNLLSNALKFTPKGGRITVSIGYLDDGGLYMSVRDTGPGIPKDEIPKVMQAFGQGSLAHENAEGGTGLGLPIVQNLIQLHGGTFTLKSELRKGTEVTVTLPKQRVLHAVAPLQPLGRERHKGAELPRSTRAPRMRVAASPYGSDQPYRSPASAHRI